MSDAVWVALIVGVFAFLGPLAVSALNARIRRQERAEDVARLHDVAAKVAENSEIVVGKLDTIHTLVNSTLTAAMQDTLDQMLRVLALLQEKPASPDVVAAIQGTTARIAELKEQLGERIVQQSTIDAREGWKP